MHTPVLVFPVPGGPWISVSLRLVAAFMASFDRYSDEAALNGSAISRGEAAAAMAEAALTEHAMSRGVAAAVAAEAALARPRMSSRSFRQAALSPAAAYRIMYPRARQLYDNAHA